MKKIKTSVVITGLICLTAIELYALSQGIDGLYLTLVVAAIAACIGVAIPSNILKGGK